ncbi:enoyl-CoA hydratase-related protein [Opitutus sp. ER46]|uniref:enoyl-CoA hydratase/isomerase family protein n=1 Tax=Opitutus sp. ER46 TaxID=2161864 RepID=UPI000D307296|nr:enoyl-CoA hydratase-related protein [Opitutus sp. ER46]PTX96427.1 enoyl-CoA hydratase/isomerase family protein [Opitutus sp. ER46]
MSDSSAPVLVATAGPVTTVTLNRPEKRNALNVPLLDHLIAAVGHAEADPTQRILVLRGAGTVFCSGLDLEEMSRGENAAKSADLVEGALRRLSGTRLMTIAAVQGAAVAGGAGLMSATDFAIATRDAKFGYPEVRRGLVPAIIMTFLRRQLRERDARELLLLGKLFTAEHAHDIGLLNRIVADAAALDAEVQSIISSLLQGAPQALSETKRELAELWPSTYEADFARAHSIHVAARTSAEAQEGIAAFHAKRRPNWAP